MFKPLTFAMIVLCSTLTAGCSANRTNLVDSGQVDLKVHETEPLTADRVRVVQANDHVLVSGEVYNTLSRAYWPQGHVDIRVAGPDQSLIAERMVGLRVRRSTRHVLKGYFSARFEQRLPAGSTVEVTHHRGGHDDS